MNTYSLARGYLLHYFLRVLSEKRNKLLQLEILYRTCGEDLNDVSLIYTLSDIEYEVCENNKSTRSFKLANSVVLK
jgi:hypothetical protein